MSNTAQIKDFVNKLKPVAAHRDEFKEMCTKPTPRISTGWLSIDIALNGGLSNELYILGAETSTGKSAFLMNLAQNVAKQGINVLYFSLEMGINEHIARAAASISLIEHTKDYQNPKISAAEILFWSYDNTAKEFVRIPYEKYAAYVEQYYQLYGNHLYIIESGLRGYCAKDIANIATAFKQQTPNIPVVVMVDYLQIIKADKEDRSQVERKSKIDTAVLTLKTLASQIGMPVIIVSSVNRSAYSSKITSASFKESGDTEYTSGVLIGWNWHGVSDTTDKDAIDAEKKASALRGYRKMEFDVLKYRNAVRDSSVRMCFIPAYSTFVDIYDWHMDFFHENPFESWDQTGSVTQQNVTSDQEADNKQQPQQKYEQQQLVF